MDPILIYRDNQEYGPFTVEEVKGMLTTGNVVESDFARTASSTEWTTLGKLLPILEVAPQIEALLEQSTDKNPAADQMAKVEPPPLPAQVTPNTRAGADEAPPSPVATTLRVSKSSGYGTTALVLSLASLTGCLFFLAVPAVILAHIERAKGDRTGRTVATLVVGYTALFLTLLLVVIVAATPEPKVQSTDSSSAAILWSSTPILRNNKSGTILPTG